MSAGKIQGQAEGAAALEYRHDQGRRLRLLSFNVQVGLSTDRYHHYVTRGWRHFLPSREVENNLNRIAELVRPYDIVGLQETDAGSLRSRAVNQVEYLAHRAGFSHWHAQVNRDLGRLAQHSLGYLSGLKPRRVTEHRLPGAIPGRGALLIEYAKPDNPLLVVVTHLALAPRTRRVQLAHISQLIAGYTHIVFMGDTNCGAEDLVSHNELGALGLRTAPDPVATYPSWKPRKHIDHILVTPSIHIHGVEVLDEKISDHLPFAMDVELPEDLILGD